MFLVFSTETGEMLGWMPDGYLQRTRGGALYALAADYLARPDAEEVGLIGSGWQVGGQILGLCSVRDIKKVRVYSSNADRRVRFSDELRESLGIEVRPVAAAQDSIADADIVALATNANEEVMESAWSRSSSRKRTELTCCPAVGSARDNGRRLTCRIL